MALQSQTYANSGNAYYIQGGIPNNPSTMTALNGPVEILFTSTIKGDYYGELNQTPSTFTISENLTSSLSTINFITMDPDPLNPTIRMGINDIISAFPGEPIIQQWTQASTIINGVFKVGTKQLNNEPNALIMFNQGNTATIKRNNVLQQIDGFNERNRFTNATIDPILYTEIGGSSASAGTVKCANAGNFTNVIIDPAKISYNVANTGKAITGVNSSAPYQFYESSKNAIEFVVDDVGAVITSLSLNKNGTITMISTLNVPTLQQGNVIQTIDGANTRTRFANLTDALTAYVEINEIPTAPSLIVLNSQAQIKITPSTIAISNFSASPSQVAKIGTYPAFPNILMIESYSDTQIRTSVGSLSTATFKENGNTELLSTLTVPYISTTNVQGTSASVTSLINVSSINGRDINTFTEPTGMMVPYARYAPIAPVGYLICDGASYPNVSYPALSALIGTTYGGDATNFKVPDMRGRASYGTVATNQNPGPNGTQAVQVNATAFMNLTVPTDLDPTIPDSGGLVYGYLCTSANGPLYKSQQSITAGYPGSIFYIIPIPYSTDFIIVTEYFGVTVPTVFPVTLSFQIQLDLQSQFSPSVYNSAFGGTVYTGSGNSYIRAIKEEVPSHTHQMLQPGGSSSQIAGGQNRAGDPNIGGPTISANNGLWSYINITAGGTGYGPSANTYIPPNVATWYIIKT